MSMSIQQILQSLLSPDTKVIKAAEQSLIDMQSQNFQGCFSELVSGLTLPDSSQSELASLLIQNKFLNKQQDLEKCNKEALTLLVKQCYELFNDNRKLIFLKRICEIIVKICAFLEKNNDIVQLVMTLNNQNSEKFILTQLYLIEIICEFSFDDELLMEHKKVLSQIFETHLNSQNINIKVAGMRTFCCFLVSISNDSFLKQFEGVFPVLLQTSIEAIKQDEEAGRTSLESLCELVEVHPKFVKPMFQNLLVLCTEVIGAKLDPTTKGCALNVLVMMSIQLPQLIRKSDFFKNNTLKQMVAMVGNFNINEDLQSWEADLQENTISKNDESSQSIDAFSRITPELGVKYLIPACFQYIGQAINSDQLNYKYAAVMILSQICIECREHFEKELSGMMDMIFSIQDQNNPRMIWGNLTCLAMLCEEYAPEIETQYTQKIVEYIIKNMQHQSVKVQLRSVSCLLNFCRALIDHPDEKDCILPFTQTIFGQLSQLFQKGLDQSLYPLIEEVLLTLSTMSEVMGQSFAQYYNNFMPGLKNLLSSLPSNDSQKVQIRVLTIECIGFMVSAVQSVQNQQIKEDQQIIMKTLIDIQNMPSLQKDDPHHAAILSVYAQLASAMKEDFHQYLPYVIDKVIQAANIHVEFQINDVSECENDEKMISKTIDLKMFGGKKTIALNAHAIEQKTSGSGTLLTLVTSLKKFFLPYTEKALPCIIQNLQYKHSKQIRHNSIKAVPGLLLACENENQMQAILNQTFDLVVKELSLANTCEDMYTILEQIYEILTKFKTPLISESQLLTLIQQLEGVMKYQNDEKESQAKKVKASLDDMDDQQREDFEADYEDINDLMQVVKDVIEEILKKYQSSETRIAQNIGQFFMGVFDKKFSTDKEKVYAVCFFDNMLLNCSDSIFNQAFSTVCQKYLSIKTDDEELMQALAYGYGVMAQRANQQMFQNFLQSIRQFLSRVLKRQDSREPDFIECTEVAVNSIGKLALFQGQSDLLQDFLSQLPLKSESEEAQNCHKTVIQQLLLKNPILSSVDVNQMKSVISRIQSFDQRNPTLEILDDECRKLLTQI